MNQDSNNGDCLIIISTEDKVREPNWAKLKSDDFKEKVSENEIITLGARTEFEEKQLISCVFWTNDVHLDKDNEVKDLKELLVKLHDWFYSDNGFIDLNNYERTVICGHFYCAMNKVRDTYNKIIELKGDDDNGESKKLEKFKNPIFGEGNIIFESYTIGGDFNQKLKGLIYDLKTITEKTSSDEDKEKISSIFREMFDLCWDNVKIAPLVELILKIKTQLFVNYHSDGKCADELKKLSTQLDNYKDILKQSTGGDSIIEKLNLENAMIDSDQLKDIDKTLESILADILNKRDGAEKQSQSQVN